MKFLNSPSDHEWVEDKGHLTSGISHTLFIFRTFSISFLLTTTPFYLFVSSSRQNIPGKD